MNIANHTESTDRIYFLDNLRYIIILLVIFLHASWGYMPDPRRYVQEPQTNLFCSIVVIVLDVFLMPMLFFIAGYFALPTIQKRGALHFLRKKWIRLGYPFILLSLFWSPILSYVYLYSSLRLSYWKFWLEHIGSIFDFHIGLLVSYNIFSLHYLWFISL